MMSGDLVDKLITFVKDVGVPAAFAFLLLWVVNTKVDQLIVSNNEQLANQERFMASCGPVPSVGH